MARKGKQVVGQIGCGFRGLENFFGKFAGLGRQALLGELAFTTTKDDGQKVVEIMRDTASKHPDCLNSLPPLHSKMCLPQRFLNPPPFCNVLDHQKTGLRAVGALSSPRATQVNPGRFCALE